MNRQLFAKLPPGDLSHIRRKRDWFTVQREQRCRNQSANAGGGEKKGVCDQCSVARCGKLQRYATEQKAGEDTALLPSCPKRKKTRPNGRGTIVPIQKFQAGPVADPAPPIHCGDDQECCAAD